VSDQLSEFERAVLAQAPRGALVAGAALSPDGRYGAALTVLPTASDYLMDDVLEMTADGWATYTGGSGGGISWTRLGQDDRLGVLRYGGEAPEGTTAAWISYEGSEHRVLVRNGHFLFVAWDTDLQEDPRLLRFEEA
jgi:hypothetical protein